MALDFPKKEKNGEKKKKVLTSSRVKYVVIAAILLLVAVSFFALAIWTSDGIEENDEYADVDHLYSAARYF